MRIDITEPTNNNQMSYWNEDTDENLKSLIGKTVTKIDSNQDGEILLTLHLSDGTRMLFVHPQDCCETVDLDDVDGDYDDIIGHPLTLAEEVSNTPNEPKDQYDESYTWTFYRLATVKGYMTLKFYGSSNGYYSEEVRVVTG